MFIFINASFGWFSCAYFFTYNVECNSLCVFGFCSLFSSKINSLLNIDKDLIRLCTRDWTCIHATTLVSLNNSSAQSLNTLNLTWIRSKSKCRTYLVLVSLGSCFQSFAYRFLSRMLFASSIHWCSQRICVYFCLCLLATHAQRLFVIADHFQCIQYRPHTLFQMIGTFLSNLFIMCDFTLFLFHTVPENWYVCSLSQWSSENWFNDIILKAVY